MNLVNLTANFAEFHLISKIYYLEIEMELFKNHILY